MHVHAVFGAAIGKGSSTFELSMAVDGAGMSAGRTGIADFGPPANLRTDAFDLQQCLPPSGWQSLAIPVLLRQRQPEQP